MKKYQNLNIKRRPSVDCDGEGDSAEMVLDRGTTRLRVLEDKVKSDLRIKEIPISSSAYSRRETKF